MLSLLEGGDYVTDVVLDERESFENLLRRFNKKVQQAGILSEFRRREHYEKPCIRRKKKAAVKRRKTARSTRSSTRSSSTRSS